jgi:hypothetical protein
MSEGRNLRPIHNHSNAKDHDSRDKQREPGRPAVMLVFVDISHDYALGPPRSRTTSMPTAYADPGLYKIAHYWRLQVISTLAFIASFDCIPIALCIREPI